MKATLLLADSAQASPDGKAHALGLGWAVTGSPSPPIALVLFLECDWNETNAKHKLEIELVDADGKPVSFGAGPLGNAEPAIHLELEFEVGRPPGLPAGMGQRQAFAINIEPGMPLTPGQSYEFRMKVDKKPIANWGAQFYVRQP